MSQISTACSSSSIAIAINAAVLGYSLPAFTQTLAVAPSGDDSTYAAALDQQGMVLLKQGKIAEACPKFAESHRIRPGTGILMRLALCHEQSGNLARAWHSYLDAAARAKRASDVTVQQLAEKRAAALEPRLSRVTLQLDQSAKEAFPFAVTCDGNPVAKAELGSSLVLDPGLHVIVATAPGRKRFVETVRIGENGATSELTISLPELTKRASLPSSDEPPRRQPRSAWSNQHTAAVISAGIGAVGVGIGSFFGLRVAAKMSDARDRCGGGSSGCPPESLALQSQSRDAARISTLGFACGAVGIASGLVLWLTATEGSKESRVVGLQLAPAVGKGTAGLMLSGETRALW
ncbi:MAG TPA: tetratricopeptide repeat protein [Polyangiaceae bacterium]